MLRECETNLMLNFEGQVRSGQVMFSVSRPGLRSKSSDASYFRVDAVRHHTRFRTESRGPVENCPVPGMLAAKAWAAAGNLKFQAQAEHGSPNLGISRWAWRQPEGAEGSLRVKTLARTGPHAPPTGTFGSGTPRPHGLLAASLPVALPVRPGHGTPDGNRGWERSRAARGGPDPRPIGDGDGGGSPIPGKSGMVCTMGMGMMDPRSPANRPRGSGVGMDPRL